MKNDADPTSVRVQMVSLPNIETGAYGVCRCPNLVRKTEEQSAAGNVADPASEDGQMVSVLNSERGESHRLSQTWSETGPQTIACSRPGRCQTTRRTSRTGSRHHHQTSILQRKRATDSLSRSIRSRPALAARPLVCIACGAPVFASHWAQEFAVSSAQPGIGLTTQPPDCKAYPCFTSQDVHTVPWTDLQ